MLRVWQIVSYCLIIKFFLSTKFVSVCLQEEKEIPGNQQRMHAIEDILSLKISLSYEL